MSNLLRIGATFIYDYSLSRGGGTESLFNNPHPIFVILIDTNAYNSLKIFPIPVRTLVRIFLLRFLGTLRSGPKYSGAVTL